MNGDASPSDASDHRAVQELLPWFVTNALNADETVLVREHLRTCLRCRDDVARQRRLRTAYPQSPPIPDADRAFSRLLQRLDMPQEKSARPKLFRHLRNAVAPDTAARPAAWIGWALAGQAGIVALLAILLTQSSAGFTMYHALGTPAQAAGNIVVIFKPETTEQQLRRTLRESGARLVDGPTEADAYVLSVPGIEQESVVRALRSNAAVSLAAPLGPGGGH